MNDQRDTLREVDWQSLCPWLVLVSALRLALGARVLLLATAGLLISTAGFVGIGQFLPGAVDDIPSVRHREADTQWPNWESVAWGPSSPEAVETPEPNAVSDKNGSTFEQWFARNSLAGAWRKLSRPFVQLFDRGLSGGDFAYSLLCGIWTIVVWSIFGGAITRIAALFLTRGELLGMRAALSQTAQRFVSFVAAPLVPLIILAVLSVLLMIPGFVSTWWVGFAGLISFLWVFVLGVGFLMALVAIGLLFGWPLMWSTLSVERTDAFDAFSRSYAYVYQRPVRLVLYWGAAIVLGLAGSVVVYAFAHACIYLSDLAIGWGAGTEQMTAWSESTGVIFWKGLVASAVQAFPIGFLWMASVGIYLLMRRDIDAAEMDEVVVEEQDQAFGLPNLADHPSGVPSVDETQSPDHDKNKAEGNLGESDSGATG